jgi:quercetin dioxygenase-like cupin family protein
MPGRQRNIKGEAPARTSLYLSSFLAAAAAVGGVLLLVGDAMAVEPVSEHSVLSQATLLEPLDIAVPPESDLELAQLTIEPGGRTGLQRYPGPVVVSVLDGTATRDRVADGSCRPTTVPAGVAYLVSPGEVDEVRNDGGVPLHLQTIALPRRGGAWATPASTAPGCDSRTAAGVTVAVLTHTTVLGQGRITTDGPSHILIGRIVIPPGASAGGWHSHPAATLVSVKDGRLDLPATAEGRCLRKQFSEGTGFVQPAGEVHDDRNEGTDTTTIYYVGISSFAGPFVVPQPQPSCSPSH